MRKLNPGVVIAALAAMAGGCGSASKPGRPGASYPRELQQVGALDIQVVRDETEIELTNTTASSFGPCTLWLNARYSKPLDGLKIGETLRLPLRDFRDEHGDAFRAGGFFATELPERLVLAQLELPIEGQPRLVGLIVIAREDEP